MVRDPSPPAPLSSKPDRIAGLKRDLFYLRRFAHPNIVTVYGAYEESGTLYMVMEYLPHSLRSRAVVAKVDLLRVLSDVARALVRLHASGHVHRDVKARNVLIERGHKAAKLCDFGLARALPPAQTRTAPIGGGPRDVFSPADDALATDDDALAASTRRFDLTPRIGPPKYRAPEVQRRERYGLSSDMYGFGVMCQQLVAALEKHRASDARRGGGSGGGSGGASASDVAFVARLGAACAAEDPSARPTSHECLQRLLDHRGVGLRLCSAETARRRRRCWISEPWDGGTGKGRGGGAGAGGGSDSAAEASGGGSDDEDASDGGGAGEAAVRREDARGVSSARRAEGGGARRRGSGGGGDAAAGPPPGKRRRTEEEDRSGGGDSSGRGGGARGGVVGGEEEEEVQS